ncbi:O-antigen ligase domain-containing protein [Hymenobacter sp. HMF4947]|uniref:O-antigen ligase domain-containing protein n=1 Tax=Hymenobacter ginkgonis TaxID=2682976 RepID=A0A7K1TF05_9BACT|nr:O-antigen ligase family protein [Hymenobacter ginkgonis]MVN76978.1 O-antigen ligase domain-containing protein [Hymenobacter ginkgonis]
MNQLIPSFETRFRGLALALGMLLALVVGWLTVNQGILVPGLLIVVALGGPLVIALFYEPRVGVIALLSYCFLLFVLAREIPGNLPVGLAVDGLLLLTWVAVAFNNERYDWHNLQNDLCFLALAWFVINILELGNPASVSFAGWFQEFRSASLYWFLTVPLVMLIFNQKKDLNLFLYLIIGLSVLGTLNGLKQLYIGLSPGEQIYLNENAKTHMLWGKLRVFSFYSDAGQFGASQAHIALVALILALGPFKPWKRVLLLSAAVLLIVGMFVSGTRGALFALISGIAVALIISKNIKAFVFGSMLTLAGFGVLKYTHIGDDNYNIYRMRTALDPNDPSLNVRLHNQLVLRDYLSSRPLGGGVGVIGNSGIKYNSDKFLSTVPPDSYWVKVWAMYGVVGFVIWLGIMLYILGKCCGIVWNTRDPVLRTKLIALTAGVAGSLFCSYGNEVINFMPSAIIVYFSWAFVFMSPRFDVSPLD